MKQRASGRDPRVELSSDVAGFREQALDFLCRDEARHNLLLGVLGNIATDPHTYSQDDPLTCLVTRDGVVVGAALMTPPYNLLISQLSHPAALESLVNALSHAGVVLPGVIAQVPTAAEFATAWRHRTGANMVFDMRHGVYGLAAVIPPPVVAGMPRRADGRDRDVLTVWIADFAEKGGFPHSAAEIDRRLAKTDAGYYLWEVQGQPVSVTGFGSFTPNGVRIGPVYTARELRGNGYASAVVAHASQQLLDGGRRFCFLYTDLSNPTSNRIYRKLGYELVCESERWAIA